MLTMSLTQTTTTGRPRGSPRKDYSAIRPQSHAVMSQWQQEQGPPIRPGLRPPETILSPLPSTPWH